MKSHEISHQQILKCIRGWDFVSNKEVENVEDAWKEKVDQMHIGRIIHVLSHQMARNNPELALDPDDLTVMQKHVLKFILLETLHKDLYQKDIEEEFQVRRSTATGILQLMEKNGYIYRESVKQDGRLKRIVPTKKAEDIRPSILGHIDKTEKLLMSGITPEDVTLCKQVMWKMHENLEKILK